VNLERLRAEHADALLAFELENRAYFAETISDRGDDYFANFTARHAEIIADQEAGEIRMHVIVDDDGRILGRVNLYNLRDGEAEIGYRIAQRATGRGLATAGVGRVCELATEDYGLVRLRARTTLDNLASRTVLARSGFVACGDVEIGGAAGITYVREL
jgi:ribosomal-protein-alanine N-acetyltransferase